MQTFDLKCIMLCDLIYRKYHDYHVFIFMMLTTSYDENFKNSMNVTIDCKLIFLFFHNFQIWSYEIKKFHKMYKNLKTSLSMLILSNLSTHYLKSLRTLIYSCVAFCQKGPKNITTSLIPLTLGDYISNFKT